MQILHVISQIDAKGGGPAVALLGLAIAQREAGLDVAVVSTFREGEDNSSADAMRARGIDVRLVGPSVGALSRHPDLESTLDAMIASADVVHIHALWEEIQHRAARIAQRCDVPYIIRPCGMLDPWSLSQGRLKKRLYLWWRLRRNLDRAAALHFTTATERDLVAPLNLKSRGIVEPNGVNLDDFASLPARGTFRARYPQLIDKPIILFLSRLHPKKGLDLLIPAFAKVGVCDAMLVLAGPCEVDYRRVVDHEIATHGIANRVVFTGMLRGADKFAAMVDADLFVLPSYQENFGNVVVECLAAGTPVIISDQVNLQSQIAQAGVGEVVPLDVDRIATAIEQWLKDAPRRAEATRRAKPFVTANFDWRKIGRDWVKLYDDVRGTAPSPVGV